jgi:hypothetical protein
MARPAADGRWAAATCGLAVPRQNGKNGDHRDPRAVRHGRSSASGSCTRRTRSRQPARRSSGSPRSSRTSGSTRAGCRLVKSIRKTNGQEAIFLDNGGSIEFIARSKGSGRGFTVDVLVCDEAQDLTDEELAALLPTISASPLGNPQVILTGTPPQWGKGLPFRRVREDGEAKRDARLAWTDFGAPDGPTS